MNTEPASTGPTSSDRATQFRQALVATANLGPYVRRRPPLKIVIGSIAAFALAGALTGGAVANARSVGPNVLESQAEVSADGMAMIAEQNGRIIGSPFTSSGNGKLTLDLGRMPAGATGLIEAVDCDGTGNYSELLDGRDTGGGSCGSESGEIGPFVGTGDHTYSLTSADGALVSVWLSWVNIPKITASAAEKAELSGGVITRDEDVAAFSRYEGCMGALGHPINVPPEAIVPSYSVDGSAVDDGADNRCYDSEYGAVDSMWQIQVETTDVAKKSIDACLANEDVTPGPTPAKRWAQLQALGLGATSCLWVN